MPNEVVVVTEEVTQLVEVTAGVPGPPGPQGPSGALYYKHVQLTPASDWVIAHNQNQILGVTVLVGGEVVEADVIHNSPNQTTIHFGSPQIGEAIFS